MFTYPIVYFPMTQPVGIRDGKLFTPPSDAQVQSDWDETDTADTSYIANKPTIPLLRILLSRRCGANL